MYNDVRLMLNTWHETEVVFYFARKTRPTHAVAVQLDDPRRQAGLTVALYGMDSAYHPLLSVLAGEEPIVFRTPETQYYVEATDLAFRRYQTVKTENYATPLGEDQEIQLAPTPRPNAEHSYWP